MSSEAYRDRSIERQMIVCCLRYLFSLSAEPANIMALGHPARGVSGAPSGAFLNREPQNSYLYHT